MGSPPTMGMIYLLDSILIYFFNRVENLMLICMLFSLGWGIIDTHKSDLFV